MGMEKGDPERGSPFSLLLLPPLKFRARGFPYLRPKSRVVCLGQKLVLHQPSIVHLFTGAPHLLIPSPTRTTPRLFRQFRHHAFPSCDGPNKNNYTAVRTLVQGETGSQDVRSLTLSLIFPAWSSP